MPVLSLTWRRLLPFNIAGTLLCAWALYSGWTPSTALSLEDPTHPPEIHLSIQQLDLGEVPTARSAFRTFEISNLGTGPLQFRVESSCVCLSVRAAAEQLAPRSSIQVAVRYHYPYPSLNHKEIIVLSNDPQSPSITVPVTVKVVP